MLFQCEQCYQEFDYWAQLDQFLHFCKLLLLFAEFQYFYFLVKLFAERWSDAIHNNSHLYFHILWFLEVLDALYHESSNCVLIAKKMEIQRFPRMWMLWEILHAISRYLQWCHFQCKPFFASSTWSVFWRHLLFWLAREGVTIVRLAMFF